MRLNHYLFLFTILISCNENEPRFRKVIDSDTLYMYDRNDTLRLKGPVSNGLKNGEFYAFDSLANIESISNYVNDTLNGFHKEYFPSGIVKADAYYVNGVRYGEELEFYDGYQDSTAIEIDGQWYIAPYSTKLKSYNYLDLRSKIMYNRNYDIEGNLISKRGRLFLAKFHDTINAKRNDLINQTWLIPAPSLVDQIDVEQHFIVYGKNSIDSIHFHSDSLLIRWTDRISDTGIFDFQAVAYLVEDGNIETDTSNFIIKITE